jgi:hypothetical protein
MGRTNVGLMGTPKRLFRTVLVLLLMGVAARSSGFSDTALFASLNAHRLRAFAAAHDPAGIEAMKPRIDRVHSAALTGLYFVALYMADPQRHQREFVANFPWRWTQDVSGVFSGPPFAAFAVVSALGQIASAKGDPGAIRVLFLGSNHSDGGPGEAFSAPMEDVATRFPRQTLTALESMPVGELAKTLRFDGCIHKPAMLRLRPRGALDVRILTAIRKLDPKMCP